MKFQIALIIFILSASNAFTQSLSLSGVLSEKISGENVIGATVTLKPDTSLANNPLKGMKTRGAISNKFGFYSITNLAEGAYTLAVRSIGYQEYSKSILLKANQKLDIQLDIQNVRTQEVVVQAEKEKNLGPQVGTVTINTDFIKQLPALGGESDIFRALQLLPGVKSASELSSGLYVRGSSPDENLTLLDGVIVYNPSHLGGFLSTFNSDAVRDVKLIKGAFPAEYGGRLASVLDITMKEGSKEKIKGEGGISMINSRLSLEGPISDNMTFMIAGRRFYLDLMAKLALLLAGTDETETFPTYYFYDLNTKLNYKISPDDRLYFSGYFGRDVLDIAPNANQSQEQTTVDVNWGNTSLNARWAHVVSPELFTNFSFIFSDYSFYTLLQDKLGDSITSAFNAGSGIRDYTLRAEGQYIPNEEHIIKSGLEFTHHRFRADATAEIKELSRFDLEPTLINSFDASYYLQDEWAISSLLKANIGGRAYYFQSGGYFTFEPRLSLAFMLNENTSLKAAYSHGNQYLHLVSRDILQLPTDLWFPSTDVVKPSTSQQAVLGIETNLFDNNFTFSCETYYKQMQNLLEYKDTAQISLLIPLAESFTTGTGTAYGLELFAQKKVGDITGWIGYTLAWTKRLFPELNNGNEFYPRYDRRHDISVVATYKPNDTWELGASWVYGTGQAYTTATGYYYNDFSDPFYDNFRRGNNGGNGGGGGGRGGNSTNNNISKSYSERNGYRIPDFHKLDLNATYSYSWFGLPFKLSMNIYNAYNRKNVFSQRIRDGYYDRTTGQFVDQPILEQTTLFPIIPTFGLSFKF